MRPGGLVRSSVSTSFPGVPMRASFLFAVPVLGVVTLGLLCWSSDAAVAPVTAATAPPTSAEADAGPFLVERALVADIAPSSGTCSVRGRIVQAAAGEAPPAVVCGATITLPGTSHRTETGADGRFALAAVLACDDASLAVAHAGAATLVRRITLWPDSIVDLGDLVLHPGAGVVGRVIDDQGRPVSNASVAAGEVTTTADADGAFAVHGLAAGCHALRAEAPGYVQGSAVRVELAAGETERGIELQVDGARALSGRVQTDAGVPIAGATIEAQIGQARGDAGVSVRVASDAQGAFVLAPLPRGNARVIVGHRDFLPFGRVCATDSRDLVITLTPTRAVHGRVVEAGSSAEVGITSVQILVSSETDTGPWRCLGSPFTPTPDEAAHGRFRLPLGIHTTARLVVLSDTHAPAISTPFWMGRDDEGPLLLGAPTGTALSGVLRDERGRPVPGAEITVLAPIGEGELVQTGASVALSVSRSDADGAFASAPLAAGRYRVQVRRAGYLRVDADAVVKAAATPVLHLTVARAGTIRGRVGNLGDDGRRVRVEAARVDEASQPNASRGVRQPTASVRDGEFVFDALVPGRYRVRLLGLARGDELAVVQNDIAVEPGQETWLEFPAPAGG